MVLLAQAVLLRRHSPAVVADAFIASRLATPGGRVYGALLLDPAATAPLLQRAFPG
jgi:putative acyl-CoA dehydrogenase